MRTPLIERTNDDHEQKGPFKKDDNNKDDEDSTDNKDHKTPMTIRPKRAWVSRGLRRNAD